MRHRLLALASIFATGLLIVDVSLAQSNRMPAMHRLADGETFEAAKLPSAEADAIFKQVEQTSFDYPESWRLELRVRRISLGDAAGLVVQGTRLLCGGTGNCQTWVFRRSNGRWISMFQRQAPIISSFGFADRSSHGIKDLATLAHASADSSAYSVFAFDGKFYRAAHCYEVSGAGKPQAQWRLRERACADAN